MVNRYTRSVEEQAKKHWAERQKRSWTDLKWLMITIGLFALILTVAVLSQMKW